MIVVCEPNCRDISHETFNLGTIYGISLAYPKERIVVFLDKTHKNVLVNNAKHGKLKLDNVEWINIDTCICMNFFNPLYNKYIIKKVINFAIKNGAMAIWFFSATQIQQRIIKNMAINNPTMCFAINMHGDIDKLAYPNFKILSGAIPQTHRSLCQKLYYHKSEILSLCLKKSKAYLGNIFVNLLKMTYPNYDLKETLYYKSAINIRYVALSYHIKPLIGNYLDLSRVNVRYLPLPAIYQKVQKLPINNYLKIAIFGYGHSQMLYLLNKEIEKRNITAPFEIRVIGMDGNGIHDFPWVTQPINRVLKRSEMEDLQKDIDMFMMLYERERYVLSVSGSIVEAHRYCKPIIYLDNPCFDGYNEEKSPIGIKCIDVVEMSKVIERLANNYSEEKKEIYRYRENIIKNRNNIDIVNNLNNLRNILTL